MIKVELLDYKYRVNDTGFKNQNLVNFNNVDYSLSSSLWNVENISKISIDGSQNSTRYIYPICGNLTDTAQYEMEITISDYNQAAGSTSDGDVGISTVLTDGTSLLDLSTLRRDSNGTNSLAFTCNTNSSLRIFAHADVTATVTARLIQRHSIMFDESIMGVLDVGDSDDFPLAINFSISEARNLSSRTGTYSKTFKIPATKNNNRVLKHSYYAGSTIPNNNINNTKNARIVVNQNFSLTGLIQITAIGKSSSPLYYSCVFYGNNVDWSQSLDNKLLMNLSMLGGSNGSGWDNLNNKGNTGVGLEVNEPSIVETWEVDNAVEKTNSTGTTSTNNYPVIYPMVGYGEYNEGGEALTVQLLKTAYAISGTGSTNKKGYYGFWDSGVSYGTPVPSCDWRPAIFIYDIFHSIFRQEGYTVVSNFIETDFFKKLLMLLPNFVYNNSEERVENNSFRGGWGNDNNWMGFYEFSSYYSGSAFVPQYQDSWPSKVIKWNKPADTGNFTTLFGNSAIYNNTNGEFTIQEYGFYDIMQDNVAIWITDMCGGTSTWNFFEYCKIDLQVKTVGQTVFTDMDGASSWIMPTSNSVETTGCPAPAQNMATASHSQAEPISLENHYFNKGDKLRWKIKIRLSHGNTQPDRQVLFTIDLWGGSNPTGAYIGAGDNDRNGVLSIMHHGEKVEYGQTYDLKNVIDNQSTQLSFLKGVIHAFNLQFTTDVQSKTVFIEPFNTFFKDEKEALDWTSKMDLSKVQDDKWANTDLKREIIFKYKTDSNDKKVEHRGNVYWDGILDEFPYREFLSNEFEVGTQIYENPFFAGSYNGHDGTTSGISLASTESTPFRALLWGLCESGALPTTGSSCRPPKGYNFVPRLLNYVKDDCNGGSWGGKYIARVQAWGIFNSSFQLPFVVAGSSALYEYDVICRACSYDDNTDNSSPMEPLTYASKFQGSYDCVTDTEYSQYGYKGLYQNYYQSMIEMQKANPRIKIVYLNLKLTDLISLDLRRLVYLDGYYYRINRIIDYKPNSNETTQVELIYWDILKTWPTDAYFNN